ncbi:hypothetical protein BS47DRAFT_1482880 [Hydnum rufescens UP504]|uniref:Uncharacterized protein n=1 Tax=Hydnum rufescens UP504 TaxID=1448309 RepID=A0A9P6B550_9AGAM|nr:hypothetical protein BS47DRAFT_1482880 [Hydnum rufescens UP504]
MKPMFFWVRAKLRGPESQTPECKHKSRPRSVRFLSQIKILRLIPPLPLSSMSLDELSNRRGRSVWEEFYASSALFLSQGLYNASVFQLAPSSSIEPISIVCISDTHNVHGSLPPLPSGDILLRVGDLTQSESSVLLIINGRNIKVYGSPMTSIYGSWAFQVSSRFCLPYSSSTRLHPTPNLSAVPDLVSRANSDSHPLPLSTLSTPISPVTHSRFPSHTAPMQTPHVRVNPPADPVSRPRLLPPLFSSADHGVSLRVQ